MTDAAAPVDGPSGPNHLASEIMLRQHPPRPQAQRMNTGSTVTRHLTRTLERRRLKPAISLARRRALSDSAFSPSWDASMAALEDLERQLAQLRERTRAAR
jgi:hypothetical protein